MHEIYDSLVLATQGQISSSATFEELAFRVLRYGRGGSVTIVAMCKQLMSFWKTRLDTIKRFQ